ncbi:hypothetical protein TeGR_g3380 [Tetraparma gracilis]|uniref:Auxin efflux carrier n=1 Tax=Tetraparma gracilis TaxID=2962635 RepID=A0ABQ6M526_9STRA|nr:hypothetical protein TeGR_g3380 [Tetraparma gracilis]
MHSLAILGPLLSRMLPTFLTTLHAIGTISVMALCGVYLHRLGSLPPAGKRALALASSQLTVPALLFTKILYCSQDWSDEPCPDVTATLGYTWPMLFLPVYVVSVGLLVGHAAAALTSTPRESRRYAAASVAFGNSTSLPITLLQAIHSSFSGSSELGAVDPALFLSVYLIIYPLLQWGVGGWLLGPTAETHALSPAPGRLPRLSESSPLILAPAAPGPVSWPGAALEVARRALQPPVVASLLGLSVAACGLRGYLVDVADRDGDAPLQFAFDALYQVGRAAVPINQMLLGANLSIAARARRDPKLASSPVFPARTMAGIVAAKLVVLPLIGILSTLALQKYVLVGEREIPHDIDASFYLVAMLVFATPTANNVSVMVELGGGEAAAQAFAASILVQYLSAPFLMSVSVSAIVFVAQSFNHDR